MVGFDPDDPSLFAIQSKVSVDLFLFRGCSPPPCSNTTYHSHLVKATAFCEEIQKEIGIVAPVCTAIRTATCSSSVLGKPARFSAAKRFKMPQKSTFLSCIVFSLYPFSDGTNAGAAERGNRGIGSRYVREREKMQHPRFCHQVKVVAGPPRFPGTAHAVSVVCPVLFDTTSRTAGRSTGLRLAPHMGISPLRGSLRAASIACICRCAEVPL